MNGTIVLTPDQLAALVCEVFKANGLDAHGLALHLDGQLVGYDRAVVHYNAAQNIKVFPAPAVLPNDRLPTFSGRENAGAAIG
jgi:hypothetical protein